MRSAFVRWLERPRAPFAIVAIALLLASPALFTGLSGDDYFHRLVLSGKNTIAVLPRDPMQMFVWANGDAARAHALIEVGMTGWWADPHMVMSFFRPLTVMTHWLDYRLWPEQPWLMHLHSLAWFALGLSFLWQLYRRLLPAIGTAFLPALALFMYAIDDAHGTTLGWIANRNAIVAFTLALPVLLLHDRAVRDGDVRAGRVAPLALALALLAGEAALAITGYLLAYALFIDEAPRARALRRLLPFALVTVFWMLVYRGLGYGARGSGLVIDPGGEPLRFLRIALERVPVLLVGQFGFPPSDTWEAYPLLAPWLPRVMIAVVLLVLYALARAFDTVLRNERSARFFGLGSVLAALPVSAQFPHDRLLMFIGIGAMPLVALVLASLFLREQTRFVPSTRLGRAMVWVLAGLHLGLAPLWLPIRVRAAYDADKIIAIADRSIDESPSVRDKTVVLLNPPLDAYAGFVEPKREAQGRNRPRAVRWLATGGSNLEYERVDARTLRVRSPEGFLSLSSERMQRDPTRNPIRVGDRVELSDLAIEVRAVTADGRPTEIVVRFAKPLEDPSYELYVFRGKRFVRFAAPAPGGRFVLPRVDFTTLFP